MLLHAEFCGEMESSEGREVCVDSAVKETHSDSAAQNSTLSGNTSWMDIVICLSSAVPSLLARQVVGIFHWRFFASDCWWRTHTLWREKQLFQWLIVSTMCL